ncbi:hypothetical protein ACFVH9_05155 [Streptomyces hirsutus]|uniref:hypothetical protein n=1 Tax=Streptomyces hirsutus TaxID=35620 RepID=UPI00362D3F4A
MRGAQKAQVTHELVSAQFEFLETMSSLDQLLRAGSHEGALSRDVERRANIVFDALSSATSKGIVDKWKGDWLKRHSEAHAIKDLDARKAALDAVTEKAREELKGMFEAAGDKMAGIEMALHQVNSRPHPEDLINRAILVSAVSAFEGLVAAAYRSILSAKPEEVISGTKEFSLADLLKFASIDDAFADSVERRVDSALRGSIEDWAALFSKFNVSFQHLCSDWPGTVEVFLRRNAFIHTQGKVNSLYLAKVTGSPPKGVSLALDEAYLRSAISKIMSLGMLVGSRTFLHLQPNNSLAAAGMPFLYMDELMDLGYWQCIKDVCANLKGMNPRLDLKFELRFAYWLACKKLDGLDSIKKDVESLDVSVLRSQFGFMRAVLLEDTDEAKSILTAASAHSEGWVGGLSTMPFLKHQKNVYREIFASPTSLADAVGTNKDSSGKREVDVDSGEV